MLSESSRTNRMLVEISIDEALDIGALAS